MRSKICCVTCPPRVGWHCGIEPYCCSSTTPERGRKKSPTSASSTSTSVHTHWCACTAKATSGAPARYGTRRHGYCTTCWTRQRHRRRRSRRYSPPEGGPSPDLASTRSCDDTHLLSTTPTSTAG